MRNKYDTNIKENYRSLKLLLHLYYDPKTVKMLQIVVFYPNEADAPGGKTLNKVKIEASQKYRRSSS